MYNDMTPLEITELIFAELDSRELKNPNIRKNALKRVWEYMRDADEFLVNGSIVLPCDKVCLKERLAQIKGNKLNSAESSVINMIYNLNDSYCTHDSLPRYTPQSPFKQPYTNRVSAHNEGSEDIEENLIGGKFFEIDELKNGSEIPNRPGLYCIMLRKGVTLPKEFGKIREDGIIYIGKASVSLRERLWEEELNHHRAATFFRSIGAILGFLPPKGSLADKKNKKNYRFSEDDTRKIIEWMRASLLVNFIEVNPGELNEMEKVLIGKYKPLLNITHNPTPSMALKAARKKCVEWANKI